MELKKKILLIDGNNLAYRNFHAQKLSTSSGQSTGMIFGTVNSMLSVQRELKASTVIVVWDPPGGSAFRKSVYKLYKANREAKETEFYDEMNLLKQLLTALGVTQVTKDGAECDDVIGYIAKCLFPEDNIFILSNDKDFLQLADSRITIMHPDKGAYLLTDGKITFKDGTKYISIRPDQIPSYKALVGDTSDNYPGMPQFGIGAAITFFETNDHCKSVIDGTADLRKLRSPALSGIMAGRSMIDIFHTLAVINMAEGKVELPARPKANKDLTQGLFEMLEFKQFQVVGPAIYNIGGYDE